MSQRLNILLVEDEFMTRRHLKKKLLELNDHIIEEANNIDSAIQILENKSIDLAILDINLGAHEKDGIWLGEHIRLHQKIPFIYLTAYETEDIVAKAVKTQPYSYLTKPFNITTLSTTLTLALQHKPSAQNLLQANDYLLVKDAEFFKQIDFADIEYLESEKNYLTIHSNGNKFKYRATIKIASEILPQKDFIQIHRAFIVNKAYVTKFNASSVIIRQTELSISKARSKLVFDFFNAKHVNNE
jgi:DNA-binding LytR/AlgR family response regulator